MFFVLENCLNDLPLEILERIFKLALVSSTYEQPNHVVNSYNSLPAVDTFYKAVICKIEYLYIYIYIYIYIIAAKKIFQILIIYRNQSMVSELHLYCESFSSVRIELKQIINDKHWNTALVMLALLDWVDLLLKIHFGKRSKKDLSTPYY